MSQELKDLEGRRWTLVLKLSTAKRIQEETDVNLLADTHFLASEPGGLEAALPALEADRIKLASVLLAACRPEMEARKLSEDEFLDGFSDGEILADAYKALVAAIGDFFPKRAEQLQKAAAAIGEAREKQQQAQAGMTEGAAKLLASIDVEAMLAKMLDKAQGELSQTLGNTSGNSLASAALPIPVP